MNDSKIRIAIIEDEELILDIYSSFFSSDESFELCGAATSMEEFLTMEMNPPEVILCDIGLPGMTGIEGIAHMHKKYSQANIVMQTIHTDEERVFAALCCGAIGYFQKNEPLTQIKEGLLTLRSGGAPMSPAIARKVIQHFQPNRKRKEESPLTPKELQVVQGLVDGLSYKLVAHRLSISIDTVRAHIRHIYRKLQVNSKTEVIRKSHLGEI